MKTEILGIRGNWENVVDDCRATVGKDCLGKEPSSKFKRSILIAEHSPIRSINIRWIWRNMKHWVTVHWSRHKWECFIRTQRSDRTGIPRDKLPQDEPQNFTGDANIQNLIDTWRKRLCYQASAETREYAEDFKVVIHNQLPEVSDTLVPNCIYRCGCPELGSCHIFERWVKEDPKIASTDIQERYDAYNRIFWRDKHETDRQG